MLTSGQLSFITRVMSHLKEGAMKWMMPSVGVLVAAVTPSHLAADDHTGTDAMKQDTMKKDTMKKDTMTKDSMSRDAMAPSTWALASSAADLSKHLGHKVTVTGSPAQGKMDAMGKGVPALTVTSLKMVAASCP